MTTLTSNPFTTGQKPLTATALNSVNNAARTDILALEGRVDEIETVVDPGTGAITASIQPRRNTLANLMSLDGLEGELSYPTDRWGVVQHNGVAGGARFYPHPLERMVMVKHFPADFTLVSGEYYLYLDELEFLPKSLHIEGDIVNQAVYIDYSSDASTMPRVQDLFFGGEIIYIYYNGAVTGSGGILFAPLSIDLTAETPTVYTSSAFSIKLSP